MKLIHIGVGTRGRQWLEIVRGDRRFASAACVDADPRALDWVRGRFPELRGVCFEEVDEALARVRAEAAVVASPPAYHANHTLSALGAGLAVLVDKPLATSLAHGARVVERARLLRLPVVVGQNDRFGPVERTVRWLVRQGRAGRLTLVTCHARQRRPPAGTFPAAGGHVQLLEAAVHHFDSLRSMLGADAVAVAARIGSPPGGGGAGLVTQAMIEMDGGLRVSYLGTLGSDRDDYALALEGEAGVVRADRRRVWWRRRGARFFTPVGCVPVPKGDALPPPREGTASLLGSLWEASVYGAEPETSGTDALRTLALVEAVKRAAEEARVVTLREVLRSEDPQPAGAGR